MAHEDLVTGFVDLVRGVAFGHAADQVERSRASVWGKRAWILTIFLLPLLGALIWCLCGPRAVKAADLESSDSVGLSEQVTDTQRQAALRTLESKEWR